jgi:hypothetical protein
MKWSGTILRIFGAWATLMLAQTIAEIAIRVSVPEITNRIAWFAATNLLVCIALGFVALHSDWRGWRLGLSLIAIPLAIYFVDILEAILFLHIKSGPSILGQIVLTYILALPLWILIFTKNREAVPTTGYNQSNSHNAWRILRIFLASDIIYIVIYLAAGLIVFPFVRNFYETQTLPSMSSTLALQFFCRGPVFFATCTLLARMLNLTRTACALAVGLVFTTLSGIVPLMAPNPYIPDSVRWFHFFEVVISNFLFGGIVAWLWRGPKVQVSSGNHAL